MAGQRIHRSDLKAARISTVAFYGSLSTSAVASCVTVVSFSSVELFFDVTVCVYAGIGKADNDKNTSKYQRTRRMTSVRS